MSVLSSKGRCERASIDEVYLDLTEAAETMLTETPPESLEAISEEALKSHILGLHLVYFFIMDPVAMSIFLQNEIILTWYSTRTRYLSLKRQMIIQSSVYPLCFTCILFRFTCILLAFEIVLALLGVSPLKYYFYSRMEQKIEIVWGNGFS